jgi:hypothetical protein
MATEYRVLESLPVEKQEWVLEMAANCRLVDMMKELKRIGIDVSLSTLQRFLRKHKEKCILAAEEDLRETASELARRGKDGDFQKGTLAAVRQKLFENALGAQNSEETRAVYGALLEEEARAKELELAARRTAAMEERLELEKRRLEQRGTGERRERKRVKAQVEGEVVVDTESAERMIEWKTVAPLVDTLARLSEILNRGGEPEGKVIDARQCLAGSAKLLELGEGKSSS